ncbi:MAG: glycoside hydrolase family 2 protein [Spirochaetaceae bacterium]|nr:MAG: glycoside hydrolase family 2 protein [Spirochaetaceae bacterium]
MEYVLLDGSWTLEVGANAEAQASVVPASGIRAEIPGTVHTDLLAAGLIPDPYLSDQEQAQDWVGRTDWVYRRSFRISPDFLRAERIELVCEGLDTLADISLNGSSVARTANAFYGHSIEVSDHLIPGENEIVIAFTAPVTAAEKAQSERFYWHTGIGQERLTGVNQLRKSQCNFGWDWGPRCATVGIWRSIRLRAYNEAAFEDVHVRQVELSAESATLHITASAIRTGEILPAALSVTLRLGEDTVAAGSASCASDSGPGTTQVHAGLSLHVAEPRMWWPNGMGDQPLYELVCDLLDDTGGLLDRTVRRIGLRTVRLLRESDEWGEQFAFEVNGIPVFAKGANWIPADTFVPRISEDHYRYLIQSAAAAHMNMLRVWGGGIYESDLFYKLCDEHGLLVWQDFMFACGAYPADKEEFMQSVKQEASEVIRRLRSHPCIALWCGNNEMEQIHGCISTGSEVDALGAMSRESYTQLFDVMLADQVRRYDPERAYWPSSPHTPGEKRADANDPRAGDAHLWMVWHGRQPFESYRDCGHRFVSEFGFQSFPEPQAVARFTAPEERNITSRIMEYHQRSPIGNDAIIQYMLSWFQLPVSNDMVLWTSQILQAVAMQYAIEHWRRSMPRGMGTLYWQLNDCWPGPSWSGIDWEGRWKALHYQVRRSYAPVLLSAVEDSDAGTVTLYVSSDRSDRRWLDMEWRLWTTDGELISLGAEEVDSRVRATTEVITLDFSEQIEQLGAENLLFFAHLCDGNDECSACMVSFVRPKHLELKDPEIGVELLDEKEGLYQLTAEKPALWVWVDVQGQDISYSDRFFHLEPDIPARVTVKSRSNNKISWKPEDIRVYSLRSTYI